MHDTPSAGTLTEHRDTVWIATKQMDVFLNPTQCESLVMQTSIGSCVWI
jgi:hypothetical protein